MCKLRIEHFIVILVFKYTQCIVQKSRTLTNICMRKKLLAFIINNSYLTQKNKKGCINL